jgi:hypothetical protein
MFLDLHSLTTLALPLHPASFPYVRPIEVVESHRHWVSYSSKSHLHYCCIGDVEDVEMVVMPG